MKAALAKKFVDLLMETVSPKEFVKILYRNAGPDYDKGSCASHDFCDANIVMDAAFTATVGRECNLESDTDTALWNEAWEIAKRDYLTATGGR